jgi:hypothetical protein
MPSEKNLLEFETWAHQLMRTGTFNPIKKGATMATRCKFLCTSVKKFSASGWHTEPKADFMYEAEFQAVTGGSDENKKFFASTPTGSLKVSTVRDDMFQPGKEYFLDISAA